MEYDRGESFPFDFQLYKTPLFGSKSKEKNIHYTVHEMVV